MVLHGLIFVQAEEADSLKINSLKKQKLFFAAEDNWIPPSWPNESSCISLGCCLMPLGGCLIGREALKKEARPESLQSIKQPKFSIGYTGGIYYTGRDLMKYFSEMTFDPIELILGRLYWLNSLEASIYYPVTQKSALEIGGGWWWAEIHPDKFENWEFNLFPIFLGYHFSKFALKLKYIFLLAKDPGKVPGSIKAEGEGKGYVFNLEYNTNKYIGLDLNLGWGNYLAKEYYPDQIYERIVNMCFNGIGFSIGYKFNIKGGVK